MEHFEKMDKDKEEAWEDVEATPEYKDWEKAW